MQELVIEAGRTERHYWRDLGRYRELFYFIAWRNSLALCKQTVGAGAWGVNPMLGVIDGFRWYLLRGASSLDWSATLKSTAMVIVLMASRIWYFRKMERTFADVI